MKDFRRLVECMNEGKTKPCSVSFNVAMLALLNQESAVTGVPKSEIVRRALGTYFRDKYLFRKANEK